jgi:ribosomal-protein-alanine N-acetyltransferase
MAATIVSERVELVSLTGAFLRASLAGDVQEAARQFGWQVPSDWPGGFAGLLRRRLEQIEADPSVEPWLLRAIVSRAHGAVVGHIGFHSAPRAEYLREFSPEAVEFGYTVYPAFRRRGYAREACIALMRWAREEHGVTKFVVSIRPDNVPSQNLARQLGFVRIGSHVDEVDGIEDVLERACD